MNNDIIMYKVKVKLSKTGYKNVFYTGVYIPPKGKWIKIDDMKERVKECLFKKLRDANSLIEEFNFTIVEFKFIKTEFILDDNIPTF